ncbi:MAG: lipase family protein [Cellvibrionaceae bacterium]
MVYQSRRVVFFIFSVCLLVSCGGGGDNDSSNEESNDGSLQRIDSIPTDNANINARQTRFYFSHLASENSSYNYDLDCTINVSHITRRDPADLSISSGNSLLDHNLGCSDNLNLNSTQNLIITEETSEPKTSTIPFSTDTTLTPNNELITIIGENSLPLNSIGNVTPASLLEEIIDDLSLPILTELAINAVIDDIADNDLPNLFNPITEYDVITQSVRYESIDPNGNKIRTLSGLIALPDISQLANFSPKDNIILLNHSTGLTPSDRNITGLWYNLAVILASRGYLVIAPDNYGLGNTSAFTETYLQAKRTGINSIDLVTSAINSGRYNDIISSTSTAKNLAIIGYSQGGHSAIAAWQEALHNHQGTLNVSNVYSGAGPYNVYETFKGIVNFVNGSCFLGEYCRYVNDELVNSYAIERILPPLLSYTNTGLNEIDITDGDELRSEFAASFLANNQEYDQLKLLLQLNSYTNISNPEASFTDPNMNLMVYHSDYDRLVAPANTREFINIINGYIGSTNDLSADCNSNNIQLLFAASDEVGIIHGICGAVMIDDILHRLN